MKRLIPWIVSNRTTRGDTWQSAYEMVVMLSKVKTPWFDAEAIREPYSTSYERSKGRVRPATPGRFGGRVSRYSDAAGALPRNVLRGPGLSGPTGRREGLGHPTQKPLWLMEKLIKASCPPEGLVLDLFAGAATTAVAAHRTGRRWIAVERDEHWGHVAVQRLQKEGAAPAKIVRLPKLLSPIEVQIWHQQIEARLIAVEATLKDLEYAREASS